MVYGITSIVPATDPAENGEAEFFQAALQRGTASRLETSTTRPPPPCTESTPLPLKKQDSTQDHTRSNGIVSSSIALLQGVEVLCSLAIMYLYKDDFGLPPASLGMVMATVRLPWAIKPVWALMSDTMPIFGYRRKSYILMGALACCFSTITMGTIGHKNVFTATLLLGIYFLGSAVCNVIGEALVVEAGRSAANGAADSVSTFFAIRKMSFAAMSYLSGWLLDYLPKQHLFLVSTVLPLSVFITGFFLHESRSQYVPPVQQQLARLREVIERPALINSTLFIFLTMVTPSAGAAMFYFMTNNLNFGPELLGRMALCQSMASLAGIITYRIFFARTTIRKLLLCSTLIVAPLCLLPVIVVQRWNLVLGIPDSVFVVTDNVLLEFLGEFQAMPILVLAARLCPPGLESTIYSVLLSGYNLGLALGALLSAGLTATLGVTAHSFARLSGLIVICSLTNFLPLLVIKLVPDLEPDSIVTQTFEPLQAPEVDEESTEDSKLGTKKAGSFERSSTMSTCAGMDSPSLDASMSSFYCGEGPTTHVASMRAAGFVRSDTGGEV